MGSEIPVLLAVAEPLFADGISNAFAAASDLEIVAKPRNRTEAIMQIRELRPRVAIFGCDLLEPSWSQGIKEIKQEDASLAILVLVSKAAPSRLLQSLQAGAAGYLMKTATGDEVVNAVRSAAAGEAVLTLEHMRELVECLDNTVDKQDHLRSGQSLRHKELEVLKLAGKGLTNKKVAQKLFVSERTVQSYFNAIFGKLGVGSRTEAVLVAWRDGWITDEDLVD
jgi:DNA-binding NarL/FixJ family response regulator